MKDEIFKLDFFPSYSYKIKILGLIILGLSALSLAISTIFKIDIEIISWVIAFSLSIISFSKDKYYNSSDVFFKYYSFKITFSFFIGFVLAINMINYIFSKEVEINLMSLLIVVLSIYQVSYNTLKLLYKKKKVEIIEKSLIKSFVSNSKLYITIIIISILSLLYFVF